MHLQLIISDGWLSDTMQSMTFETASQFHVYIVGLRLCLNNSNLNVKALVGAFYQKKALIGAFSVIVKSSGTFG